MVAKVPVVTQTQAQARAQTPSPYDRLLEATACGIVAELKQYHADFADPQATEELNETLGEKSLGDLLEYYQPEEKASTGVASTTKVNL